MKASTWREHVVFLECYRSWYLPRPDVDSHCLFEQWSISVCLVMIIRFRGTLTGINYITMNYTLPLVSVLGRNLGSVLHFHLLDLSALSIPRYIWITRVWRTELVGSKLPFRNTRGLLGWVEHHIDIYALSALKLHSRTSSFPIGRLRGDLRVNCHVKLLFVDTFIHHGVPCGNSFWGLRDEWPSRTL